MAIISVINQKGGCGKTTTAVNLASGLAKKGFRVLLVDMDPQGHSTLGLGFNPDSLKQTIFDVIDAREQELALSNILLEVSSRLDIAPANVFLSAFEQSMAGKAWRESRLAKVLFKVKNQYDYIIIDCPPSLGLLTINALLASTHAIVPIDSGFYSLAGVKKLKETLEMLQTKVHHNLEIRHLVTFHDATSALNKDFRKELIKTAGEDTVFKQKIRRSIKFNASQRIGKSVMELGVKKCGVAYKDYHSFILEVVEWTKAQPNFKITMLRPGKSKTSIRTNGYQPVSFGFKGNAREVMIAGSFNNWQPVPMRKENEDNWKTFVQLKPGAYEYKFIVDGTWITDPGNASFKESDNIVNSLISVKTK